MPTKEVHIRVTETECDYLRWLAAEVEQTVTAVVRHLIRQSMRQAEANGEYVRQKKKKVPK